MNLITKIFSYLINNLSYMYNPIAHARRLGVKIGKDCRFSGKVQFGTEPYLITIGNHVSISCSNFITHDGGVWIFRDEYPKVDIFGPISIGNNVFIGSGCTILPGVSIGDNVVVGAGSIITKDLNADSVYAGTPAKKIKTIDEYKKNLQQKSVETKFMTSAKKRDFLMNFYFGS